MADEPDAAAQILTAGAPRPIGAARRTVALSVEATWSAPASGTVSARLEYAFFDRGNWRATRSFALTSSAQSGSGTSTGRVTFPLAGTWRIRQKLSEDATSCASAWVTVKVAAYRPRGRIRLVMFGDSMAGMPGAALKRLLKGTAASPTIDYKSSSGVSRPDFFNWPARVSSDVRRLHPKVVLMMFGANDWQNMRSRGHIYGRGTKAWDALYAKRLGRMVDAARAGDAVVYLVGQPISGRSKGYAAHMAHINAIAARVARERIDVRYISTWSLFATPSGHYASSLRTSSGHLVKMRSGDKIHFSGAGALRLARFIRTEIQKDWRRFD